ncbi:hypothetical protein ACFVH6_02300 [Spirillospora sp. NPDC127200]
MSAPHQSFQDLDFSGDGNQNVFGNYVGRDAILNMQTFVRNRPAFFLGRSEIDDRIACHVPARNHDQVVKALESDRAVLLGGPVGSGRETSAIAAMNELRPGLPIRRFSTDDEDVAEIRSGRPCGYLVRAPEVEEPTSLRACLDAVRDSGGYLTVTGDEEQRARLGLPIAFLAIESPGPLEVYRRRLTVRGLVRPEWVRWPQAAELLDRASPADARRLADIVEAMDRDGKDAEEAVHAYQRWEQQLRTWFRRNPEPQDRALLISAAALDPASDIDVYTAALALARRLRIETNGSGLGWCPTNALHELLETRPASGWIEFKRHGYAQSVIRHVWAEYPLTRPDLLSWLTELVLDPNVADGPRRTIAGIFAELTADAGLAPSIGTTARAWAEAGLADPAYLLLSRTCLHPKVGGKVRRFLYERSREPRAPQTLKLTIARVCEQLGKVYPSIALTRLKHLAANGNAQVRAEVAQVVLGLAHDGNWPLALSSALEWSRKPGRGQQPDMRRMSAGAAIFLEMAMEVSPSGAPRALGTVDMADCVPAWRVALAGGAGSPCSDAVRLWLDAALGHPALRRPLIDGFVDAGLARPDAMVRIVQDWTAAELSDAARRRIGDEIVLRLTQLWWLRLWRWLLFRLRNPKGWGKVHP